MDSRDSKARQESSNERARKDMAEFKARQAKLNERIIAEQDRKKTSVKSGVTEIKPRDYKNKEKRTNKEQKNIKDEKVILDNNIRENKSNIHSNKLEGIKDQKRKTDRGKIDRARDQKSKVDRSGVGGVREEKGRTERIRTEKNREDKKFMSDVEKHAKVEERARKRLENVARIDERARKEAEKMLVESVNDETNEDKKGKKQRQITGQSHVDTSLRDRLQSMKKVTDVKSDRKKDNKEHKKVTDIQDVKRAALENEKKRRKEAREEHIRYRIEQLKTTKAKVLIASFVVIVAFLSFVSATIINNIEIDEGKHYTEEQIKRLVIKNVVDYNSVYLFLKYRYSEHEAIPFVEYIDVSWVNKNAVKIKVYDKNIIGCTNFMNEYVYFDKDGMVVETAMKKEKDIPYITGIEFEELTLNSKIRVADEDIFEVILTVTQQVSKYNLDIQEINFDKDYNLTLYSGDITVLLGKQLTYDEQLAKLQSMLREAKKENLKGILHMEKYKEGQDRIIFDKND